MLIGLHGKAGAGKDQSYQYIREWAELQGRKVRREAFADRLKLSAARALGFKGSLEEAVAFCNDLKAHRRVGYMTQGRGHPMSFVSGREYLQLYGTEAHREIFGDMFWIAPVIDTYEPDEILVITDVRFANEAVAIRDHGGSVWHIVRPDTDSIPDWHASEQPLPGDLIDHTIVNAGTLDQLRDCVLSGIERLVYA